MGHLMRLIKDEDVSGGNMEVYRKCGDKPTTAFHYNCRSRSKIYVKESSQFVFIHHVIQFCQPHRNRRKLDKAGLVPTLP